MNVDVAKAVDEFQPVVLTEPNASGAKAFTELTKEFLQKLSNLLALTASNPPSES
jgi:cellulose biosynthesis protein BcsQ